MGSSIYKIFEYAYIAMAIFSLWLVYENWTDNRGRAYLFIFFAVVAVFMFFFKRRFRRMIEEQRKNDSES